MKTAISLPDNLFQEADGYARSAGISRSELYALALTEYLARREEARITQRLNAVYGSRESGGRPELPAPERLASSRLDLW